MRRDVRARACPSGPTRCRRGPGGASTPPAARAAARRPPAGRSPGSGSRTAGTSCRAPASAAEGARTATPRSALSPWPRTGRRRGRGRRDERRNGGAFAAPSLRPCLAGRHQREHEPILRTEVSTRDTLDVGDSDVLEDFELAIGGFDVVVDHDRVRQLTGLLLVREPAEDVVARELVLGPLQFMLG